MEVPTLVRKKPAPAFMSKSTDSANVGATAGATSVRRRTSGEGSRRVSGEGTSKHLVKEKLIARTASASTDNSIRHAAVFDPVRVFSWKWQRR